MDDDIYNSKENDQSWYYNWMRICWFLLQPQRLQLWCGIELLCIKQEGI